jgi:hypothetical protein
MPLVAEPPSESATLTLMLKSPAADGLQVISGDELEVHPAGRPDQE